MVKLPQVWHRYTQAAYRRRVVRQVQRLRLRNRTHGARPHPLQDVLDVEAGVRSAALDGPLHHFRRLFRQGLHHADVVLDAAARPVLFFQSGPQFAKQRRQMPAAKDVGMIQRGRLPPQRLQVVLRVKTLFVLTIRPGMPSDHLAVGHHVDVVHVALDRHRLKRGGPRRAVAIVVEADGLVLVHLGRLEDARVERKGRQ